MHSFRVQSNLPSTWRNLVQECFQAAPHLAPVSHEPNHTWTPAVDVVEEADRYLLLLDVPGVDPATVAIELDRLRLTVSGERSLDRGTAPSSGDANGEAASTSTADTVATRHLRRERLFGGFKRSFNLPESVNVEAISAAGKHGVLEISIPKQQAPGARRIAVRAN